MKFLKKKKKSKRPVYVQYLIAILQIVILFIVFRTWIIQAYNIPSSSMEPTLLIGDHLLVLKSAYSIKIPQEIDFSRKGPRSDAELDQQAAGATIIPLGTPKRGDIIVFRAPENREQDFIKRLIGLPGEKVEIKGKEIYINDKLLNDPWGDFNPRHDIVRQFQHHGPVLVPENHYFVMGDNRDNSKDSRLWFGGKGGFVHEKEILGKALIIYFSYEGNLWNVRYSRLFNIIN